MYGGYIGANRFQIPLIRRIEQGYIVVEDADILLLEHLSVLAEFLVSVFIVLAIF